MSTGSKKRKIDCAYLNCGADANIGNNLTVQNNLTVIGTIEVSQVTVTNPGSIQIPDGTNSNPSLQLSNSHNTGLFNPLPGAGKILSVSCTGSEVLRVTPSEVQTYQPLVVSGSITGNDF